MNGKVLKVTAHKHAEMIKAKADNMDLVVFVRMAYDGFFTVAAEKECIPSFHPDNEYFLSLPQHKDACFHWLNGGEVEFDSEFVDEWTEYEPFKEWGVGSVFMQDDYKARIKPRKEKRWIGVNSKTGVTTHLKKSREALEKRIDGHSGYQIIEIEVEV